MKEVQQSYIYKQVFYNYKLLFQNLETIPRLKDEIKELKEEIDAYKQESNEKTALLVAARKAVGEYKDKLRVSGIDILAGMADERMQSLGGMTLVFMALKGYGDKHR